MPLHRRIVLLIIICFSIIIPKAKADHCAGGDLTYQWLRDSTYRVTLQFYRDCSGIQAQPAVTLCVYNSCNGTQLWKTLEGPPPHGNPIDGGQVLKGGACPGHPTRCDDPGSSIPGYHKWTYYQDVTLPFKCDFWTFAVGISARNTSSNLWGIMDFYCAATLNNKDAPTNSSPAFTIEPIPYTIMGSPYNFNNNAIDKDGDSLIFETITPMGVGTGCNGVPGTFAPKSPGLNVIDNPFQTNKTYYLDRTTGAIKFTSAEVGAQTFTVRVLEVRNGRLVGSVMRDIQVQVLPGEADTTEMKIVEKSLSNCLLRGGTIYACTDVNMSFCFDVTAKKSNTMLVIRDSHDTTHPGSNVIYSTQAKDSVRGCFSLYTDTNNLGLKNLIILQKDSTCREPLGIATYQVYSIPIHITKKNIFPGLSVVTPVFYCQNDPAAPLVAHGVGVLWYDTLGGVVGKKNAPIPSTADIGMKKYYCQSNTGCQWEWATVTVYVVAKAEADIDTKDSICISDLQTLTNKKYKPGISAIQYKWTFDTTATIISNDSNKTLVVKWKTKGWKKVKLHAENNYCSQTDSMLVFVSDTVGIPSFKLPDSACSSTPVTINTINNNDFFFWKIDDLVYGDSIYTNPVLKWVSSGLKKLQLRTKSKSGCYSFAHTDSIFIKPSPAGGITYNDEGLCLGDALEMSTEEAGDYVYNWQPANLFNNSRAAKVLISHAREGKITLSVSNDYECLFTDSTYLAPDECCRVMLPDAFTPNKDGLNDRLKPIAAKNITDFKIMIANRWGQVVYKSEDLNNSWDGKVNGMDQDTGAYSYYMSYKCEYSRKDVVKKGILYLIK